MQTGANSYPMIVEARVSSINLCETTCYFANTILCNCGLVPLASDSIS